MVLLGRMPALVPLTPVSWKVPAVIVNVPVKVLLELVVVQMPVPALVTPPLPVIVAWYGQVTCNMEHSLRAPKPEFDWS